MLKRLAILALTAFIAVVSTFWLLAIDSQSGQALGLVNGQLASCPSSPNCVCSEFPADEAHFISPLSFAIMPSDVMMKVNEVILSQGGEIHITDKDYLAATFSSDLFGFVDDLELRIDHKQQLLHIRSAARVGHSDLGVNRERAQQLRQLLTPLINP